MSKEFAFYTRARGLVPKADAWRDSAERVLYWSLCALDSPGTSAFNDLAYKLVDRCFKVSGRWLVLQRRADILAITAVFHDIGAFYAEARDSKDYITIGPKIRPDDAAYADVGGWKAGNKKGLTFVLAECETKSDEDLTDIMMHESVHFAGGIGHYMIAKGKPAYGDKVFSLTIDQALENASSYAYLAYLARLPSTQWLTAT